jgi:hypothetical protein
VKKKKPAARPPATSVPSRTLPAWTPIAAIAAAVLVFYWVPMTSSSASIQWDAADLHYPMQKYFAGHALEGKLPFWTPYLFAGYPFLANPEIGAWYAPHWPFFILGVTPRAIQCELALNALLACLGAYMLMRRLVDRPAAAVLGAFAYGLSGFFAGHSSHISIFCGAACFPWLLLAYRRAIESSVWRFAALGALAGGLMILAGYAQIPIYGFLALGLFALAEVVTRRVVWWRASAVVAAMLAGAFALAAVQILPGLELTDLSLRGIQIYPQPESGLEARPLLTLALPDALNSISGHYNGPSDITQYYFYAGMLLLPLAALGAWRSRLRIPALALIVPTLWFMAGPAAGLYRLAGLVTLLHKFRAPIQGWFIVALGLAMLAAAGADWILGKWRMPWLGIALAALIFVDVWYWNSLRNPMAYARGSFEELYGAREDNAREQLAATQPPLTRFDAPRYLAVLGPLDHPLDLKLETTYGYFALEPRIFDEYIAAMGRNPKLRAGLDVTRVLNAQNGALESIPSPLPRVYFPKQVVPMSSEAESEKALETLDPALQSTVLSRPTAVQQNLTATAEVTGSDEQSYRVRYRAASPSLLKLSVDWVPRLAGVLRCQGTAAAPR